MQSQCQVVERQQQTLQWRFLFEGTECLSKHEEVKMQGSKSWESTLVVPAILVLVFWLEFCGDLKQIVQIVIYSELKMHEKNKQHVLKFSFRFVVEVSDWHVFAVMSLIASDSFSWGYWLWDWKVITCMTLSAGPNRTTMSTVCFISALIQFDGAPERMHFR